MVLKIDLKIEAGKLGKDLELLGEQAEKNLKTAIKQLSLGAYNEADRLAAQRLFTSRENYRNALKYEELSDDLYVIYLDPKNAAANFTESGWDGFDMKNGLLNGPKARVSKKGKKFNIIPFQQHPYSKDYPQDPVKKQVVADLREAIQSIVTDKSINKTVKKFNDKTLTYYKDIDDTRLQGLTKISSPIEGKKSKHSQFFIFRVVSENSDPSTWMHPGYKGAKVFPDLDRYIRTNIERILRAIL